MCICTVAEASSRNSITKNLLYLGFHLKRDLLTLPSVSKIRFFRSVFLFLTYTHEFVTLTEIWTFLFCNYDETGLWCKDLDLTQCTTDASTVKGYTVYYVMLPTDILCAARSSGLARHCNLTSSHCGARGIVSCIFLSHSQRLTVGKPTVPTNERQMQHRVRDFIKFTFLNVLIASFLLSLHYVCCSNCRGGPYCNPPLLSHCTMLVSTSHLG